MGRGGSNTIGFADVNFYALVSYKAPIVINQKVRNNSLVSVGMGIAKNSRGFGWATNMAGRFDFSTFEKHDYFPFLIVRYDYEFVNKKGKNIFNCYLNYQQGIFKRGQLIYTDEGNVGPIASQVATSRGSNLAIGITRPIRCIKPKK
jgi:hypothetical protein